MEILIGVIGVAVGALASWLITRAYYTKGSRDLDDHTRRIVREFARQEYEEIIDLVLKSDSERDWRSISPGSIGFRKWVSYKRDVRIHFRTSYEKQCENFSDDWATRHPSKEATGYWYYLYFADVPIYEFIIVSIDGGRAHVPAPSTLDGKISPLNYVNVRRTAYSSRPRSAIWS